MDEQFKQLQSVCADTRSGESMALHTSMKVGGPAWAFCVPAKESELQDVLRVCRRIGAPWMVLGNGTNVLFTDEGFDGVVISMAALPASRLLSSLAAEAAEQGLSGLEALSGIPGSVGGALFMNAGAYGREMKDVVREARVLVPETGTIVTVEADEMDLGYRTSRFQKTGEIILSVTLDLHPADRTEIAAQMADFRARRTSKQPLSYPSCGSFFKRPEGHFAGQLIEEAGLKGLRIGDAQISELHAGFLINRGHATCAEILQLVHVVQATVEQQTGIRLEPEVRIVEGGSLWKPSL